MVNTETGSKATGAGSPLEAGESNAAPSLAYRYALLLKHLDNQREGIEAGFRQEAALNSLVAVMRFLDGDPAASRAVAPIAQIAFALADVMHGNNPELFVKPHNRKGGRPSERSSDIARAGIVRALENLLPHMSRRVAGSTIAAELRRLGIRDDRGRTITAPQVHRWRDEIGGRAPAATTEMHARIRAQQGVAALDADKARDLARAILARVKDSGF